MSNPEDYHVNCRSCNESDRKQYSLNSFNKDRPVVEDYQVSWDVKWEYYNPLELIANRNKKPDWADEEEKEKLTKIKWNRFDNGINRASYTGLYSVINHRPRNPKGRTGIIGRGKLGRWGPNHAADAMVTRWKKNDYGKVFDSKTNKPILQFVSILRKDTKIWAIPGGMCDVNEEPWDSAQREFIEEAFDSTKMTAKQVIDIKDELKEFFKNGLEIYSGYVDDPRNTDNAWMETYVINYHDENDEYSKKISQYLKAGDDAIDVAWKDIGSDLKMYANHLKFVKLTAEKHKAHF